MNSGGLDDPLVAYEHAFSGIGVESTAISRAADTVALRFPDPDERRDASGRIIPHDFVLIGPWADGVSSAADGIRLVWPVVADEFERVWDSNEPPPTDR